MHSERQRVTNCGQNYDVKWTGREKRPRYDNACTSNRLTPERFPDIASPVPLAACSTERVQPYYSFGNLEKRTPDVK